MKTHHLLTVAGVLRVLSVLAASFALSGLVASAQAQPASPQAQPPQTQTATFAAGCFWCLEEAMQKLPGVISAVSGYIDGHSKQPTYAQVSAGGSGHTEAVEVRFDPAQLSYAQLLEVFWFNHDPTTLDGQFCDHGSQYRPGIYWHDEEQKRLAEASRERWHRQKPFKARIVTPIVKASRFWPAEDYHQDYYKKNPVRYAFYVNGCGRYARLDELWGALRKSK